MLLHCAGLFRRLGLLFSHDAYLLEYSLDLKWIAYRTRRAAIAKKKNRPSGEYADRMT
jgi:hypothetical protein